MKALMEFLIVVTAIWMSWRFAANWRRKRGYGPVVAHLTGALAAQMRSCC